MRAAGTADTLVHREDHPLTVSIPTTSALGEPTVVPSGTPARFGLLPRPLVAALPRPLTGLGGRVAADNLADPSFVAQLSVAERQDLKAKLVSRLREPHMRAELNSMRLGSSYLLPAGFNTKALSTQTRIVMRRLIDVFGPRLDELSWDDVLGAQLPGIAPGDVLEALSELEGVLARNAENVVQDTERQIRDLLADSALDAIRPDDVRFGWDDSDAESVRGLLRNWQRDGAFTLEQKRYVSHLAGTVRHSLRRDVEDIARALAQTAYKVQPARERAVEIFIERYGCGPLGARERDIAERRGLTQQRVGQILTALRHAAAERTVTSLAANRLLDRARELRTAAMSKSVLESALGLPPAKGQSVRAFRHFCRDILGITGDDYLRLGGAEPPGRAVAVDLRAFDLANAVHVAARLHCRAMGAAHIATVTGELLLDKKFAAAAEDLRRIIDSSHELRWLDREAGWFMRLQTDTALERRVREILAVAAQPVAVADIAAALFRDHRRSTLDRFAWPPLRIFTLMLKQWDGVEVNEVLRASDRSMTRPEDLLTGAPLEIYQALARRGGVVQKSVLAKEVSGHPATVRVHIDLAAFVYSVSHDLYALVGWPLKREELLSALLGDEQGGSVILIQGGPRRSSSA